MSGECCVSCDEREAEAREAGRIAPDDVPVTMTELREIWKQAEEDGQVCNGITGAVLRERYGDRLYHVIGVGWFIRRRPERPDFREPGRALARFTQSHLLPGYGEASTLQCFMYVTAAVFAADRAAADAFADAHDLRGPLAHQHHAEMSS